MRNFTITVVMLGFHRSYMNNDGCLTQARKWNVKIHAYVRVFLFVGER